MTERAKARRGHDTRRTLPAAASALVGHIRRCRHHRCDYPALLRIGDTTGAQLIRW